MGKTAAPIGTDGPFTPACAIRGATEVCLDMYEDERYFHDPMEFVLQAIALRMRAWRQSAGQPIQEQNFAFTDDSIELLSPEAYSEVRVALPQEAR